MSACLLLGAALVVEGYPSTPSGAAAKTATNLARGWSKVPVPALEDDAGDPPAAAASIPQVSGHAAAGALPGRAALLFGGLTGPAGSPCADATWEFVGGA